MKTKLQAFTLLEVLMVLTIASILITLSIPSILSFLNHQQETTLQHQLKNILETAHQEASVGIVAVCRSTNNKACEDTGNNWLVFFDEKDNGVLTDKDKLISVHHLNVKAGTLVLRSFPSYRHYLRFSGGDIVHADNATIGYYKNKKLVWSLVVNQAGRVRVG
ncbi:MAG: pilus assembly FimT family protein [Gammaproteobacteria bacterium]